MSTASALVSRQERLPARPVDFSTDDSVGSGAIALGLDEGRHHRPVALPETWRWAYLSIGGRLRGPVFKDTSADFLVRGWRGWRGELPRDQLAESGVLLGRVVGWDRAAECSSRFRRLSVACRVGGEGAGGSHYDADGVGVSAGKDIVGRQSGRGNAEADEGRRRRIDIKAKERRSGRCLCTSVYQSGSYTIPTSYLIPSEICLQRMSQRLSLSASTPYFRDHLACTSSTLQSTRSPLALHARVHRISEVSHVRAGAV